jgi:hypothetical protein
MRCPFGRRQQVYLFRQHRWSAAICLLGAGMAQACTAGQHRPAIVIQAASPLIVSQADGGFVIRANASRAAEPLEAASAAVTATVPLGSDVHFDRRALLPTQQKEIPHGETR